MGHHKTLLEMELNTASTQQLIASYETIEEKLANLHKSGQSQQDEISGVSEGLARMCWLQHL
jgi:hypothetical protein